MNKRKFANNVKKKNCVSTYLKDQTKEALEKKALESNSSVSDYVRTLIILSIK